MKLRNFLIAFFALATLIGPLQLSAFAQADTSAQMEVFGLRFGDTFAVATSKGLSATLDRKDGTLTIYKSLKLPNQPSTTDVASLIFDDRLGLQKITWLSNNITEDPFGSDGKQQYSELKSVLQKKYGSPDSNLSFERTGLSLYKDGDEFYECLDYSGCGMWAAMWKGSFGTAGLSLESSGRRGIGWLKLAYEGPAWSGLVDARKNNTRQADASAF